MSSLKISITGTGYVTHPAERAILTLEAHTNQLPSQARASEACVSTANALRDIMLPHCPQEDSKPGAGSEPGIAHYAMSTMDTTYHTPRVLRDQPPQDPLFSARAMFTIKFRDFGLLNELATRFSGMENVRIDRIDWQLTDVTNDSLKGGARKLAAQDAIQRAYDYAQVFADVASEDCKKRVRPVEVKESDYYQASSRPRLHYGKLQRGKQVESNDLHFEPEDVGMTVKVTAEFRVFD